MEGRSVPLALAASSLLVAAALDARPAQGQAAVQAEPASLEEIVVTARRFAEPLREAPLTVAALDAFAKQFA